MKEVKEIVYCPHCRRLCRVRYEGVRLICVECDEEVNYDGPPVKEKEVESIRQEVGEIIDEACGKALACSPESYVEYVEKATDKVIKVFVKALEGLLPELGKLLVGR